MTYSEPWSKKHKKVTRSTPFSLSNSFAQPLTSEELIEYAIERGDSELLEMYQKHDLGYTPNGGSLDLREEIAKFYEPVIGAENIVVFTGGQVALQTVAIALSDKDSHAIVFEPGYQSVQAAPSHAGSSVTTITLAPDAGWQIDLVAVKSAIQPSTKYIVINEPFNPAGTLLRQEVFKRNR